MQNVQLSHLMQVIENAHGRAEEEIRSRFYRNKKIDTPQKLWMEFKKVWAEVTTPKQVQDNIELLHDTYTAIIKAGGKKTKRSKKTS